MGKSPAFQMYSGDWLKDPQLSMCSPATRGIWIDLICAMHELGRCGQVTGTVEQLCRICRCTSAEMFAALNELKDTRTATVTEREGRWTIINRRMSRESHERESATKRKQSQRLRESDDNVTPMSRESHAQSHAKVTLHSSSSLSSSDSGEGKIFVRAQWLGQAQDELSSLYGGLGAAESHLLCQQLEIMAQKSIRGSPVGWSDLQRYMAEEKLPQVNFLSRSFSSWIANQNRRKEAYDTDRGNNTGRNGNLRAYESKPEFEPTEGRL